MEATDSDWQMKRRYSHLKENLPKVLKIVGYPLMAFFNLLGLLGYLWIDFVYCMNNMNRPDHKIVLLVIK